MLSIKPRHLLGMLIGAVLGIVAAGLSPQFGYDLARNDGLFWGGAIGGVLSGAPEFARSGKTLTQSENRVLNSLVGLFGGLILIGLVGALLILVFALIF